MEETSMYKPDHPMANKSKMEQLRFEVDCAIKSAKLKDPKFNKESQDFLEKQWIKTHEDAIKRERHEEAELSSWKQ